MNALDSWIYTQHAVNIPWCKHDTSNLFFVCAITAKHVTYVLNMRRGVVCNDCFGEVLCREGCVICFCGGLACCKQWGMELLGDLQIVGLQYAVGFASEFGWFSGMCGVDQRCHPYAGVLVS